MHTLAGGDSRIIGASKSVFHLTTLRTAITGFAVAIITILFSFIRNHVDDAVSTVIWDAIPVDHRVVCSTGSAIVSSITIFTDFAFLQAIADEAFLSALETVSLVDIRKELISAKLARKRCIFIVSFDTSLIANTLAI